MDIYGLHIAREISKVNHRPTIHWIVFSAKTTDLFEKDAFLRKMVQCGDRYLPLTDFAEIMIYVHLFNTYNIYIFFLYKVYYTTSGSLPVT